VVGVAANLHDPARALGEVLAVLLARLAISGRRHEPVDAGQRVLERLRLLLGLGVKVLQVLDVHRVDGFNVDVDQVLERCVVERQVGDVALAQEPLVILLRGEFRIGRDVVGWLFGNGGFVRV